MKMDFDVFKLQLVLRRLDEIPDYELHALILDEAEHAAFLARRTAFAWLVFPCLFEERAAAALERERAARRTYWAGLQLAC